MGHQLRVRWPLGSGQDIGFAEFNDWEGKSSSYHHVGLAVMVIICMVGLVFWLGTALHGGIGISATNRKGLEQLCRYIARPPLSQDRLELRGDGNYLLHLKSAWSDGTTSLLFFFLLEMLTHDFLYLEVPEC